MMENMDTSIGMVLDKLSELGLEENTHVIFSWDNSREEARMWKAGIPVPMIAAGPKVPAISQCDKPVAQWDDLTTMHDLLGTSAPLPDNLDGVSIHPVFEKGNRAGSPNGILVLGFIFLYFTPFRLLPAGIEITR